MPTTDKGNATAQSTDTESQQESQQPSRRRPKVLAEFPELSPEANDLYTKHRNRRASDNEVKNNAEVMALYAHLAKLDPSSGTYDPPAYHLVPTPRGGLDTLVGLLLGPRPGNSEKDQFGEYVDAAAQRKAVVAQHEYDVDASKLKFILFRMNSDILRTDDRYVLGQLVRVPSEF